MASSACAARLGQHAHLGAGLVRLLQQRLPRRGLGLQRGLAASRACDGPAALGLARVGPRHQGVVFGLGVPRLPCLARLGPGDLFGSARAARRDRSRLAAFSATVARATRAAVSSPCAASRAAVRACRRAVSSASASSASAVCAPPDASAALRRRRLFPRLGQRRLPGVQPPRGLRRGPPRPAAPRPRRTPRGARPPTRPPAPPAAPPAPPTAPCPPAPAPPRPRPAPSAPVSASRCVSSSLLLQCGDLRLAPQQVGPLPVGLTAPRQRARRQHDLAGQGHDPVPAARRRGGPQGVVQCLAEEDAAQQHVQRRAELRVERDDVQRRPAHARQVRRPAQVQRVARGTHPVERQKRRPPGAVLMQVSDGGFGLVLGRRDDVLQARRQRRLQRRLVARRRLERVGDHGELARKRPVLDGLEDGPDAREVALLGRLQVLQRPQPRATAPRCPTAPRSARACAAWTSARAASRPASASPAPFSASRQRLPRRLGRPPVPASCAASACRAAASPRAISS